MTFLRMAGAGLIELIEKIGSLNCCLRWRALGEVIRRACRRRTNSEWLGRCGDVRQRIVDCQLLQIKQSK